MGSIVARLGVALGIASCAATLAAEPPVAIVDSLGPLAGSTSVEVSLDGSRAAAAFPPGSGGDRSTIKIASAGKALASVEVPGDVRALLFDPAGSPLYVVQHRASKRHPTESILLRIDVATLKTLQRVTLPVTTRSIDLDGGRDAILVACVDEVRTFALPALTSGPLYRLPGENLVVAAVPRSMRILVGRADEIAVIDPRSQQGRDGIPILARVKTPGPVAEIVPGFDGGDAVARLADGRTFRVDLAAMTLEEADPAPYLVRVRPADNPLAASPPPPPPSRPAPAPAPAEGEKSRLPELPAAVAAGAAVGAAATSSSSAAAKPLETKPVEAKPQSAPAPTATEAKPPAPDPAPAPPPSPPPSPAPPPPPSPSAPPPVVPETKAVEEKQPAPAPPPVEEKVPVLVAPPPSPPPPPEMESKAPPSAPAADATRGALRGTVTGPAASLVVAVLAMGPDSVIREAARMAPDATGAFTFEGLSPGRYRIVVDGGGRKALVCEPPFVTIEVSAGTVVVAPELRILRAL